MRNDHGRQNSKSRKSATDRQQAAGGAGEQRARPEGRAAQPAPPASESNNRLEDPPGRPPASTSRGVSKPQADFLGGEDTAEIALYLCWGDTWEETCQLFDECKADAADEEGEGGFFDLGGWTCQVMPSGARGVSGPYRAYVILALGMRFEFCKTPKPKGDCPNGKLVIGSTTLIRLGLERAWEKAKELIESLDGELVGNKLSRVDACLDMPSLKMVAFADSFSRGDFTCRSRDDHNHRTNRKIGSFSIGSDPRCRIYDKAKELRDRPDSLKEEAMRDCRWGGQVPVEAPRVEWQMRRETIKSFKVDSVEDWFKSREGVIDYLFTWLRFVDTGGKPFRKKNAERYPPLAEWEQAREGFKAWALSEVKEVTRHNGSKGRSTPANLREIAGGCLLASHAQSTNTWEGFTEFMNYALRELATWYVKFENDEVGKRWLQKRREFEAGTLPGLERRQGARAKIIPFNTWLREMLEKGEAIAAAGGQLPLNFPWDGFDLSKLHTIVGD